MSAKHTPGPWYWHIDSAGRVSIRTPDRGNLIVLDFARKGMQGAQPRFAEWPGIYSGVPRQRLGGILMDADHWTGSGVFGINHPDAHLIVAAPALLDAARAVQASPGWQFIDEPTRNTVRTSIAKATGEDRG